MCDLRVLCLSFLSRFLCLCLFIFFTRFRFTLSHHHCTPPSRSSTLSIDASIAAVLALIDCVANGAGWSDRVGWRGKEAREGRKGNVMEAEEDGDGVSGEEDGGMGSEEEDRGTEATGTKG